MPHPDITGASVVAIVLLVPLRTQIRVRNVAVLTLIGCTTLLHIMHTVNTLVWAYTVRDVAPIWCDVGSSESHLIFVERSHLERV
jgi:pheromone a factor receptor